MENIKIEAEKLYEISCKLSGMAYVLRGCCMYYEGMEIDAGKLIGFTEILYETSRELFGLFMPCKVVQTCEPDTSL